MAKIPAKLELAEVQASFRDLYKTIEQLTEENLDLKGRRVVNAAAAQGKLDYVTLEQAQKLLGGAKAGAGATSKEEWGVRVARTGAGQNIANGTYTDIIFTGVDRDVHGLWAAGDPTKVSLRRPGWWIVGCTVRWNNDTTSYRETRILKTTALQAMAYDSPSATGNPCQEISTLVYSLGTDYVTCNVRHAIGSTLAVVVTAGANPVMWAHFLSGP